MPTVQPYIGRIKYGNQIIGTGFIVHQSGLIATCYHVLNQTAKAFVGKTFTFEPLVQLDHPS